MSLLEGIPEVHRFAPLGDGRRNIAVEWPSGARVMVEAGNEDPEAVARELIRVASQAKPKRQPFPGGCVRIEPTSGRVWLLSKPATGWSASGYCYRSIDSLMAEWNVELGPVEYDTHGTFRRAIPVVES